MRHRLSLTSRLTLLFAAMSVLLLLGFASITVNAIDRHFASMDREELEGKLLLVRGEIERIATPAALDQMQGQLHNALVGHPNLLVTVLEPDGKTLFTIGAIAIPSAYLHGGESMFEWHSGGHTYRGLARAIPTTMTGMPSVMVGLAIDTIQHDHFLTQFALTMTLFVAIAALFSGLLGWIAARNGLAPLRAMKARAASVTARKLDLRLPVESVPVEMADLAATLNEMLERLEQAFQRLSDFSSDLAHELRTPISNLMVQTQVALSQARSSEAYRDILASNSEEFERLSRTISDMLFIAKAEHGLMLPSCESIDLSTELRELFDYYDALVEVQGVALVCSGQGTLHGDRLMIRRALSNLLSNAIRHAPQGSQVKVGIDMSDEVTRIDVSNKGDPIPPAQLPRLFERFYRADTARTRDDTLGAGLGLAIVKTIVTAHGGNVKVSSDTEGTRFSMFFPRTAKLNQITDQ